MQGIVTLFVFPCCVTGFEVCGPFACTWASFACSLRSPGRHCFRKQESENKQDKIANRLFKQRDKRKSPYDLLPTAAAAVCNKAAGREAAGT